MRCSLEQLRFFTAGLDLASSLRISLMESVRETTERGPPSPTERDREMKDERRERERELVLLCSICPAELSQKLTASQLSQTVLSQQGWHVDPITHGGIRKQSLRMLAPELEELVAPPWRPELATRLCFSGVGLSNL